MLEEKPEKVFTLQGAVGVLTGGAVGVTEGDVLAIVGDNVFLAAHAAIKITGKLLQRFFPAPHALTVDDAFVG